MEAPRFSSHTWDKATKAKVTLENYYSNLISQHSERKQRLQRLEESLRDEPEEQKSEKSSTCCERDRIPSSEKVQVGSR